MSNYIQIKTTVGELFAIPITASTKPEIPEDLLKGWQNIANIVAEVTNVPAALIMRLHPKDIEVYVTSNTPGNPYSLGAKEQLSLGLYCEETIGRGDMTYIHDALDHEYWHNNPDIRFGMTSYLGLPIRWPDGEFFGTICILDGEPIELSGPLGELLRSCQSEIERSLSDLTEKARFKALAEEQEISLLEAHHSIKNHLNMLANIIQVKMINEQDEQYDHNATLEDILKRISIISEVHDIVSLSKSKFVNVNDLIKSISEMLILSSTDKEIKLQMKLHEVHVCQRVLFLSGVLVSELIVNSIKHAFDKCPCPTISISVTSRCPDRFSILYKDNGCGITESHVSNSNKIGNRIINSIPKQFDGYVQSSFVDGVEYNFAMNKRCFSCSACISATYQSR